MATTTIIYSTSKSYTCVVALVGGGSNPQPGEISLAHNGVLFLDELPEWKSRVYLPPEGEVALTPENVFILTPKEPWPVGSFLFRLTCLL